MPRPRKHPGSVTSKILPVRVTEDEFNGVAELVRRQRAALHSTGADVTAGSFIRGLIRRELAAHHLQAPTAPPPLPTQGTLPGFDLASSGAPAGPGTPLGAPPVEGPAASTPTPPPAESSPPVAIATTAAPRSPPRTSAPVISPPAKGAKASPRPRAPSPRAVTKSPPKGKTPTKAKAKAKTPENKGKRASVRRPPARSLGV